MSSTVGSVDPRPARQAARPDVVRPLSRAAARTCARPGCPSPASSTLTFRYDARQVLLDDLSQEREPDSYDLCVGHAERTGPPHGWTLDDRRRDPEAGAAGTLGGERTVALLAQMLGRDRDGSGPAESGPAEVEVEVDVDPPSRADAAPAQAGLFDDDAPDAPTDGGPRGSDGGARADAW